jgi:hypothetical protein
MKTTNYAEQPPRSSKERPGLNFWLTTPYAIRGYRNGQVTPYEVVKATLKKNGQPVIDIRLMEILSSKGRVRVRPYTAGHLSAPVVRVKPDPDYMHRKDGGMVDARGNKYALTHRPLMALAGQFINLE